jgi:DNA topoisomerase III
VLPFVFHDKKITESQYLRLVQKGSTVNIKGFKINSETVEGLIRFEENYKLKLEPKKTEAKASKTETSDSLACPKCKKGTILKGKTAYGCAEYKSGCDFKVTFDDVRTKLKDQKPTKELVYSILQESV